MEIIPKEAGVETCIADHPAFTLISKHRSVRGSVHDVIILSVFSVLAESEFETQNIACINMPFPALCSVTSVVSDSLPLRTQRPLQAGQILREESPPSGQEKCTRVKTVGREIQAGVLLFVSATLGFSPVRDSLQPQGLQPARLLCPRGFSRQESWSG